MSYCFFTLFLLDIKTIVKDKNFKPLNNSYDTPYSFYYEEILNTKITFLSLPFVRVHFSCPSNQLSIFN